jgi:uncharacterized OB-fold protein
MRHVVRVAAYLPTAAAAGLDEDEFTLAATAVERAWFGRREEPGPVALHLLGDFPPVAEWGFAAVLGRETEVVHHPGDAGELAATLRALEEGEGGPAFLVASELSGRRGDRSAKSSSRSAGAVAFLLEPAEESAPLPLPKSAASRSALAATLKLGELAKDLPRSVTFVGDWDRPTPEGPPPDRTVARKAFEGNLASVSEGAYVPRPRYLENLPSRWRFLAELCSACHGTTFPARGVCRRCGRRDRLTPLTLPTEGARVVAVTTVGKGGQPTEFDSQVEALGPYDVALIELSRGMRVTLQVTDSPPGVLKVGDRVNTLLRRLYPMEGEWRYGRKAVPVAAPRAPPPASGT